MIPRFIPDRDHPATRIWYNEPPPYRRSATAYRDDAGPRLVHPAPARRQRERQHLPPL